MALEPPAATFSRLPFLDQLEGARSVLVAGAGGGFDVYAGLPLFEHLRARGVRVHLANLSFTDLRVVEGERLLPNLVRVDADSVGPERYFPEGLLSRWFRGLGVEQSIYCFEKTGHAPLRDAYQRLVHELEVDAIVLVDGGTDILMRGDEASLGTPAEDVASLSAVHALRVPTKQVVCLGFGVDRFHGVCHAHFLENVARLSRRGAYLGVLALLPEMPEVRAYLDAVDDASARMVGRESIVNTSIASAVRGHYGDVHATSRTHGSRLWINPLMSMYWAFGLDAVAEECLYLEAVKRTHTISEICLIAEAMSHQRGRPREDIPV